ncbi:hypothetical protein, partial [Klebsiella aerogenes]|uniref:hypothetical protein n=1 Tax=Klebsiella aerogenes TaxID=548 RepID=UPI001954864C
IRGSSIALAMGSSMSFDPNTQRFSTASIHAGYEPEDYYGSINTPIYASTTFAQNAPNELLE